MSKEAMKLALEALEWMVANDDTNEGDEPLDRLGGQSWNEYNSYWIDGLNNARTSITALREALAEDDSVVWGVDRAPAQQEPVNWSDYESDGMHHNKPAQQEPLIDEDFRPDWMNYLEGYSNGVLDGIEQMKQASEKNIPPAQRKPLTDEQVNLFINGRGDEDDDDYVEPTGDGFGLTDADLVRLVRRVEAAHGIKGDA